MFINDTLGTWCLQVRAKIGDKIVTASYTMVLALKVLKAFSKLIRRDHTAYIVRG